RRRSPRDCWAARPRLRRWPDAAPRRRHRARESPRRVASTVNCGERGVFRARLAVDRGRAAPPRARRATPPGRPHAAPCPFWLRTWLTPGAIEPRTAQLRLTRRIIKPVPTGDVRRNLSKPTGLPELRQG